METSKSRIEQAAEAKKDGNVIRAEQIYHDILSASAGTNEAGQREQESALTQLGQLYRDQRFATSSLIRG